MKGQNYKVFVVKNVLLKRYGSSTSLVPCHLEFLMSSERLQKLTMLFHSQIH